MTISEALRKVKASIQEHGWGRGSYQQQATPYRPGGEPPTYKPYCLVGHIWWATGYLGPYAGSGSGMNMRNCEDWVKVDEFLLRQLGWRPIDSVTKWNDQQVSQEAVLEKLDEWIEAAEREGL